MPATAALPIAPSGVQAIAHHLIDPSPLNPRKALDAEALAALADSIADKGVLQNLVLRPHPAKPGRFELVAGERRWRAVCLAVRDRRLPADFAVPAAIRAVDDGELLLLATAENVARADLSPLEEGRAFKALLARGVAKADLARRIGRTVRHVELRLALVDKLAPEAQQALETGAIDLAKARALALAPAVRQAAILKDARENKDGFTALRTAADVARRARDAQILVGCAAFPLADYTGAIETDPDDPKRRYFADTALFDKLQKAALAARQAALAAKWPWVKVVTRRVWGPGDGLPHEWERATGKAAGALIVVDSGHRFPPRVFAGVVARPAHGPGGAKPDPAAEQRTAALRVFGEACRDLKTAALQRFILARPLAAQLLAAAWALGWGALDRGGAQFNQKVPAANAELKRLGLVTGGPARDAAKAFAALAAQPAPRQVAALTAAVAAAAGFCEDEWTEPFGEDAADVAAARALKFDPLAGWTMDHAFLDACPEEIKRRIAADVGADVAKLADPKFWNATIRASPKAKAYRPPWLELGTAAELAARLKAAPAKPAAKAKAKPARRKKGGRA